MTRRARFGAAGCLGAFRPILLGLALVSCSLGTEPTGPVADVRGTWNFVGTQAAPALDLVGTIEVTQQSNDLISGTVSWEETNGVGGVELKGGALTGRVIGLTDIDFDVILDEGDRRHVGRVTADSLVGVWASTGSGLTGEFRAARQSP